MDQLQPLMKQMMADKGHNAADDDVRIHGCAGALSTPLSEAREQMAKAIAAKLRVTKYRANSPGSLNRPESASEAGAEMRGHLRS